MMKCENPKCGKEDCIMHIQSEPRLKVCDRCYYEDKNKK